MWGRILKKFLHTCSDDSEIQSRCRSKSQDSQQKWKTYSSTVRLVAKHVDLHTEKSKRTREFAFNSRCIQRSRLLESALLCVRQCVLEHSTTGTSLRSRRKMRCTSARLTVWRLCSVPFSTGFGCFFSRRVFACRASECLSWRCQA